jgi:hypothetical protein
MALLVYQILFVPACNGGLAGWAGRFDFLMPWRVHGDFLFVVCADALILTQVGVGASPEGVKSTMGRNKPIVKNIVACASRLLSQRFEREKARIPTIKRKPLQCVCVKREYVKL